MMESEASWYIQMSSYHYMNGYYKIIRDSHYIILYSYRESLLLEDIEDSP